MSAARVIVGMSGGVDSSVAALLLQRQDGSPQQMRLAAALTAPQVHRCLRPALAAQPLLQALQRLPIAIGKKIAQRRTGRQPDIERQLFHGANRAALEDKKMCMKK